MLYIKSSSLFREELIHNKEDVLMACVQCKYRDYEEKGLLALHMM